MTLSFPLNILGFLFFVLVCTSLVVTCSTYNNNYLCRWHCGWGCLWWTFRVMLVPVNESQCLTKHSQGGGLPGIGGVSPRAGTRGCLVGASTPKERGVMENGAMAGTSPLPEMGQHQMSQTWRSTLASPLLPSESSSGTYPSRPTWKPVDKGAGKCISLQYSRGRGSEWGGGGTRSGCKLPIMWIKVIIFPDVQRFLHSVFYSFSCQIIYVSPAMCKPVCFSSNRYLKLFRWFQALFWAHFLLRGGQFMAKIFCTLFSRWWFLLNFWYFIGSNDGFNIHIYWLKYRA